MICPPVHSCRRWWSSSPGIFCDSCSCEANWTCVKSKWNGLLAVLFCFVLFMFMLMFILTDVLYWRTWRGPRVHSYLTGLEKPKVISTPCNMYIRMYTYDCFSCNVFTVTKMLIFHSPWCKYKEMRSWDCQGQRNQRSEQKPQINFQKKSKWHF